MKKIFVILVMLSKIFLFNGMAQNKTISVNLGDLRARNIGPAVMSGRVSDIVGVNKSPEILYVGAANGGVWKSLNGGTSFKPIFDEHTQSIGKITIDQNHPDTVWVGTGESWVRNSVSVGDGIYVTKNGGNTWQKMGLNKSERIADIIIDPQNSSTLYVAVQGALWADSEERGVYKSTDFGATWERVLFVNKSTGCTDLAIDPTNSSTLWACMWEHRRYPDYFHSGGEGSGLYKSLDGGKTWNKINAEGFPKSKLGRLAIAIAPSNSNTMYLTVESENESEKGLYRSENKGDSWKKVSDEFNTKVRPFYFARIEVDPTNEKRIFKAGLNMVISDDGGTSFRMVMSGVHSDSHCAWINPKNSKNVFIGTDGGAYCSWDNGYTFKMFMDLPISQFYHVAVDDEKPYNVYGGLQDNGSWYAPSTATGGIQNKHWNLSYYGDGFWSMPHPTDKNIVYSESQGGELARHDKSDGQTKNIKPILSNTDTELRFNWNTPIATGIKNPEKLYIGAQFLFLSENRGDTWKKISPDLTTNDPKRQRQKKSGGYTIENSSAENNATIYWIQESPLDDNIIWVGTDDGNLQLTTDAGLTWTNVVANINTLPQHTWCSSIQASNFDKKTVYASFDGHKQGDMKPYLFKSEDYGKNWKDISKDLQGYVHIIKEDYINPNLLFAGTEFGLFISLDGGESWKQFDNNFPKVSVMDLALHHKENSLIIATHGRGVYIIDDISPLRDITEGLLTKPFHYFKLKESYLPLNRLSEPFGAAGNYVGENPDESIKVTYFMPKRHTLGKMYGQLFDTKGNKIREISVGKSAGLNIVNIPVRYLDLKPAPTNNREAFGGGMFAPTLEEGTYIFTIKKGSEEFSTPLEIRYSPEIDAKYPTYERQLQHATLMRLYNLTNQLGYIYYALQGIHTQCETLSSSIDDPNIKKKLLTCADSTKALKESLTFMGGDFYINAESKIREDISELYGGVSSYPGKPTEGQLNKTKSLEDRFKKIQDKFKSYIDLVEERNAELKSLNKSITYKTFEEYMKD
ncbi:MAG: hypothetical protein KA010_00090 [Saprospiraceae bacterium]|nr:hypothetical protein [Saprospiraceae bacterium]